jgi:transcriptional regulator with XRE-family HTH domain
MWKFQKIFLERLNALRGDNSIVGFARDCGIPQQTMSAYCKGERVPGAEALLQIATTNVVSLDWLFGLTDSRTGTCAPAPSPESLAEIAELKAEVARLNAELAEKDGIIQGLKMAFEAVGKGK